VAAGPLGHNVCDDDAVVVNGEHRVSTGCPGEVHPVHPRVASEDHIRYVTDGPYLRKAVDDFRVRQASAAYDARNPAAGLGRARADATQLGA
jgi:hypothetical protein